MSVYVSGVSKAERHVFTSFPSSFAPSLPSPPLVHSHVISGLGVGQMEGAARGHRQEGRNSQEAHAPPPPNVGHGQVTH